MKTTFDQIPVGSFFVFAKCDGTPDGDVHKKIVEKTGENYRGFRTSSETSAVFTVADFARPADSEFTTSVTLAPTVEAHKDRPIIIDGFDEPHRFSVREACALIKALSSGIEMATRK
jgi:hypothetical protein